MNAYTRQDNQCSTSLTEQRQISDINQVFHSFAVHGAESEDNHKAVSALCDERYHAGLTDLLSQPYTWHQDINLRLQIGLESCTVGASEISGQRPILVSFSSTVEMVTILFLQNDFFRQEWPDFLFVGRYISNFLGPWSCTKRLRITRKASRSRRPCRA